MPRKPNITPSEPIMFRLPLPTKAKLDMALMSELEGRIPYAAYQKFFDARIKEFFEWETLELEQYGYPPGFFVRGPKEMVAFIRDKLGGAK